MSHADPDIPREDFLVLFQDVAVAITSSLDLEETLEKIVRRTAEAFDVWECNLYEYSPETDALVATRAVGTRASPRRSSPGWARSSACPSMTGYRADHRRACRSSST